MNKKRTYSKEQEIEQLLKKFYSGTIAPDELQTLYAYFMPNHPVADTLKKHVAVVQPLAIMHSRLASGHSSPAKTTGAKTIHTYTWKHIATAVAAIAAIVLLIMLPTLGSNPTNTTLPMPQYTYIAQAETPKTMALPIPEPEHSPAKHTKPTTPTPQPDTLTTPILNTDTNHNNHEMLCTTQPETTNTTPLERYNDHTKWEIYCSDSCSSEYLNNTLANALYATI